MLKRSLLSLAVLALAAVPAHAGGRPMRLHKPLMVQSCSTGRCYAPPPVVAYPVAPPVVTQAAPARVLPSPSSPPPAVVPVSYAAPVAYYQTWPVPRGR